MMISGVEKTSIWVCSTSHQFVSSTDENQAALMKGLRMEQVDIVNCSVLLSHEGVQHAGT